MKKILFPTALVFCTLALLFSAFKTTDTPPTSRVGYVSVSQLVAELPEYTMNRGKLDTLIYQYNVAFRGKMAEFKQKEQSFVADSANMLDAIKTDKITELRNLVQSIEAFRQVSQVQVDKADSELVQPIFTDLQKAINETAAKHGYTHIINTDLRAGNGSPIVLFAVEDNDVSNMILEEYRQVTANKSE